MTRREFLYEERMWPIQPPNSSEFDGGDDLHVRIYKTLAAASNIIPATEEFVVEESPMHSVTAMASDPILLRFLRILVLLKNPKNILEIGTFVGVSAMSMARGMSDDGKIVTLEKFPHFAEIAQRNFDNNGFKDRIELAVGDAFEWFSAGGAKNRKFDFVYLDGNKERYDDYFALLDPVIVPGGLLIVDNVFFHGDVMNDEPHTDKGKGVRQFLRTAESLTTYHKVILPIGDGVMLMIKK